MFQVGVLKSSNYVRNSIVLTCMTLCGSSRLTEYYVPTVILSAPSSVLFVPVRGPFVSKGDYTQRSAETCSV